MPINNRHITISKFRLLYNQNIDIKYRGISVELIFHDLGYSMIKIQNIIISINCNQTASIILGTLIPGYLVCYCHEEISQEWNNHNITKSFPLVNHIALYTQTLCDIKFQVTTLSSAVINLL